MNDLYNIYLYYADSHQNQFIKVFQIPGGK